MSETKWTPGPWTARANTWSRFEIYYSRGHRGQLASVAKHDDPSSPPPVNETEANARLIAAAPELYDALDEIIRWIGVGDGKTPEKRGAKCEFLSEALAKVDIAMKKARGER